jgi:superfamily II DNA or RNA helicase
MKNYPAKTFLDIGAVFYDESHHLGSEVFSQAMPKLSVKYIIGLSATPTRKDGLEKVFY